MAFIDYRLETCVAYGFVGGPEWSTEVVHFDNGNQQRNAMWAYPKHRYSAQYLNLQAEDREEVMRAFYAARGQLHNFRFKDHNNHSGVAQPFQLIGGLWRMVKEHDMGSETAYQLVQAPVAGQVSLSGGSLANLNFATGVYTGDASAITWTGEFDIWVHFASDYNAFAINNLDAHTADIELEETRRS